MSLPLIQESANGTTTIDPRVIAASTMHANGMQATEIADNMAVDRVTVHRWLKLPEAQELIRLLRDNAVSALSGMSIASGNLMLAKLADHIQNGSPGVSVNACRVMGDLLIRLRALAEFGERLAAVEEMLKTAGLTPGPAALRMTQALSEGKPTDGIG